jgi:predicted nucleic acid-binding protein
MRERFVALIRHHSRVFVVQAADVAAVEPRCRDPKDDKFLALLAVAEADVLVSSEEDLLILHPWRGLPVLMPEALLR